MRHGQVIRFFVTVVLAYLVYVASYWVLSRVLWSGGPLEVQNVVAICLGDAFNFWLNRWWTFQAKGSYTRHMRRFILVAGSSLLLQALLFWIGRSVFQIYDLALAIFLPGLRALYNYVFHKYYTFREDVAGKASVL